MPCGMNKEKTTWHQKWNGFRQYLKEPKTRFDIKDWVKAVIRILLTAALVLWLLKNFIR